MSDNEEAFHLERRGNEDEESIARFPIAAGAKLTKDGNEWCYLLGDNLQVGVSGFGKSPRDAAIAFRKAYDGTEIK